MKKRVFVLMGVCAMVMVFSTLFGSLDAMALVVNDYAQYYFFKASSTYANCKQRQWNNKPRQGLS